MDEIGASAHCDARAQRRCADHPHNYLSLPPPFCAHKPTIRFGTDNRHSHRTRRRCCRFVGDWPTQEHGEKLLEFHTGSSNPHDSRSLIEISRSHPGSVRERAAKIPTKTSLRLIVLLLNLAAFVSGPSRVILLFMVLIHLLYISFVDLVGPSASCILLSFLSLQTRYAVSDTSM